MDVPILEYLGIKGVLTIIAGLILSAILIYIGLKGIIKKKITISLGFIHTVLYGFEGIEGNWAVFLGIASLIIGLIFSVRILAVILVPYHHINTPQEDLEFILKQFDNHRNQI